MPGYMSPLRHMIGTAQHFHDVAFITNSGLTLERIIIGEILATQK